MACLISLGQLLLLVNILFQHMTALPVLERSQEDVEGLMRRSQLNSLVARNYAEDLLDDRPSLSEGPRVQTRQLGDIEFSNMYAEHLQSMAKLNALCSFLRRMQHVKKSSLGGDVNQMLKQYMCPSVYQWNPDL
ncbi:hypothetical protein COCON_G00102980 [Conger conger]|uniref:Uncharacterized protein n=1 Tax=Conger conger TaxID=82655 RepID=A0A9Q1HZ74_CONCO|nr:hypothetical protein COCON_G00102980 [Conger conger]